MIDYSHQFVLDLVLTAAEHTESAIGELARIEPDAPASELWTALCILTDCYSWMEKEFAPGSAS